MQCLDPPLSAMPPGQWVCLECVKLRREAPAGPEQALPEADPVLFPNTATRRRDQEAAAFDGKRVKCSVHGAKQAAAASSSEG